MVNDHKINYEDVGPIMDDLIRREWAAAKPGILRQMQAEIPRVAKITPDTLPAWLDLMGRVKASR